MSFYLQRNVGRNLVGMGLGIAVWFAIAWVLYQINIHLEYPILFGAVRVSVAAITSTILVTKFFDKMPLAWSGIGLQRWTLREFALGKVLGFAMGSVACGIVAFIGTTGVSSSIDIPLLLLGLLYLFIAAVAEEMVFRGYLFQRLVEMLGPVAASILSSALFALAHIGNPSISFFGIINIFIGGLFFCLCYLRTGSLWLPIAAHFTWNATLGLLFGLPVSGNYMATSILTTPIAGAAAITGRSFGPEGGLVATLALLLGIVAVTRVPAFAFSPYTYSRLFWGFWKEQRRRLAATTADTPSTPLPRPGEGS